MNIIDFDVCAYLKWLGVEYWESGKNVSRGWIGMQCIYCVDNHNHLGVNLTYKSYSCWKCDATGSALTLIQDLESINYGAAVKRVGEFQNLLHHEPVIEDGLVDVGQDILPDGCGETLTGGQQSYLRGRGFEPGPLAEQWGLRSGPMFGKWRYRIIIPITLGKKIMTWVGLDPSGTREVKYLAAPVTESFLPMGELLYGADDAQENVLVMEGPADVWRMGPGTVATLGMAVTPAKLNQLLQLKAKQYYIMFDGEPRAIQNAHRLAYSLSNCGKQVEVLELDSGDPGEFTNDEAQELRDKLGLQN